MSQVQCRQSIASLCQSLFSMFQQLGFTENKLDSIQESLDALVSICNDKTKDAQVDLIVTVDKDRKERREKDKKGKDKKDKKEDVVMVEPATEVIAKNTAPKRKRTTVK